VKGGPKTGSRKSEFVDFSIKSGRLIMIDACMEKDDELIPHHHLLLLQNDTKQSIT
jgi:hypothetical protein